MLNSEKIKAIGKNVIIKPDKEKEFYGSIYIPEKYRPVVVSGVVVATGKDVKEVESGEYVVFPKNKGWIYKSLIFLKENDIILKVKKEA